MHLRGAKYVRRKCYSVVGRYVTGLLYLRNLKAKAKAYNTCRAPQVTYRDFRGAGHVTGQASVGRRP